MKLLKRLPLKLSYVTADLLAQEFTFVIVAFNARITTPLWLCRVSFSEVCLAM